MRVSINIAERVTEVVAWRYSVKILPWEIYKFSNGVLLLVKFCEVFQELLFYRPYLNSQLFSNTFANTFSMVSTMVVWLFGLFRICFSFVCLSVLLFLHISLLFFCLLFWNSFVTSVWDSCKASYVFHTFAFQTRITAQKMKFSIKGFFGKCDQICSFMRIWSHLLKKSLMDKFIVCAVQCFSSASCFVKQFLSSLYFFEKIFYVFHESTLQYLKKNSRSNNSF